MSKKNNSLSAIDKTLQFNVSLCESKILKIARYYFMTFAEPSKQTWLNASEYSIKQFSADQGPFVALAVLSAIQAMRQARKSEFKFNDPDCKLCARNVTEHERAFINIIRCKVRGQDDAASAHAIILCEGNDHQQFLNSALILAAVCFPNEAEILDGQRVQNVT